MPKFSFDGQFVVSGDDVGAISPDWGWKDTTTAIGYRYDPGLEPGLYTLQYPAKILQRIGDFDYANRVRFFANNNTWLAFYTFGSKDNAGNVWADRCAIGVGDNGEKVFVQKPTFDKIIIRYSSGNEVTIPAPGYTNAPVTMRQGVLMWDSVTGPRDIDGNSVGPKGAMQTFTVAPDGQRWCVGYVGGWGLAVWKWGSTTGYVLSRDGKDFYPDIHAISNTVFDVVSAETQADTRLRRYTVDTTTLVTVDLLSPPVDDFNHPILLTVFKDPNGTSGSPAEIVVNKNNQTVNRPYFVSFDSLDSAKLGPQLGIYYEDADIRARQLPDGTRALVCHDNANQFPDDILSRLRPWDIPMLEFYRVVGEDLPTAVLRWEGNLRNLLQRWPGDIGVVPQFYCMGGAPPNETWPVEEVVASIAPTIQLINISSRIKVVAPFSYERANGIVAHSQLQAVWEQWKAAAQRAGIAQLTPLQQSPPSPPSPQPPPAPPVVPPPTAFIPLAKVVNKNMNVFLKINGKFMGVDPNIPDVVYFDRDNGNGWEEAQLVKQDTKFVVKFIAANRILTQTPDGKFETRPVGAVGAWEMFTVAEQPDGTVLLFRVHEGKLLLPVLQIKING